MKSHIPYGVALIAAIFAAMPIRAYDIPPLVITCDEYVTNIETTGGTVTLTPNGEGTGWTLTAVPDAGWKFLYWEDDHENTVAERTLTTLDAGMDASLVAKFQRVVYNCVSEEEYFTEIPEPVAPYSFGSIDTITTDGVFSMTATPEEGWKFLYWEDDHDNTNPVRELSNSDFVGADLVKNFEAKFQRFVRNCTSDMEYVVAINNPGDPYEFGTIDTSYIDGKLYMTAIPEEDYTFVQWADGVYANPRPLDTEGESDTTFYAAFMPSNPLKGTISEWLITPEYDGFRITLSVSADEISGPTTLFIEDVMDGRPVSHNVHDQYFGIYDIETPPYDAEVLAGKKCHLILKNNDCEPIATLEAIIPYLVTGNEHVVVPTNTTPVHVLWGGVANFSSTQTIGALDVYPGGKAVITESGNLSASDIILRSDWPNNLGVPYLQVKGRLLNTRNTGRINYDCNIDYHYFYAFAVPYSVASLPAAISYTSGETAGSRYVLGEYLGDKRADGLQAWDDCYNDDKEYGTNIDREQTSGFIPRKGYYIFGDPECWQNKYDDKHERRSSMFRFPMTINLAGGEGEEPASIAVNQYPTADGDPANMNWNFLGSPYLTSYKGRIMMYKDEAYVSDLKYVIVPRNGRLSVYDAEEITKVPLDPFTPFFVQFKEDINTLKFEDPNPSKRASAPKRLPRAVQTPSEVAAGITLSQNGESDHIGVFISGQYTDNYDVNGDLAKMLSEIECIKLFSMLGSTKLAYTAVPPANGSGTLETVIPLGYDCGAVGSTMTFAIDTRRFPELLDSEDVYALELVDHLTGETKDLMSGAYTCTAYQKSDYSRFALNVRYRAPQQQEIVTGICCDTPRATAMPDGVYDLLGRPVTTSVLPAGAYIIVENGQTRKEVIR